MLELIISQELPVRIIEKSLPLQLIVLRKLTKKEIQLIQKYQIKRFFLPPSEEAEQEMFFKHFDKFWDQITVGLGKDHPFWRNGLSSKMQEWEQSLGYLLIVLFRLKYLEKKENLKLIVLTQSAQETDVWRQWAELCQWKIINSQAASIFSKKALKRSTDNCFRVTITLTCVKSEFASGSLRSFKSLTFKSNCVATF